jgi:glycerophosphoryl diester phosphodiesterase
MQHAHYPNRCSVKRTFELFAMGLVAFGLQGCAHFQSRSFVESRTVWSFANPADPFAASKGPGVLKYRDPKRTGWGPRKTQFGRADRFGLPSLPGGNPRVMRMPATAPDEGYTVIHHAAPNGVLREEGFVSNYTLVVDLLWPSTTSKPFGSLYQTAPGNADDGDLFFQDVPRGGIGVDNVYNGSLRPGRWHRIAVSVQAATGEGGVGQIQKFIDGHFVGAHNTAGIGKMSRWALGPVFHLFTDNDNDTAAGYVASIFFTNRNLSFEEVAALGGPSGAGADVPGRQAVPVRRKAGRRVQIIAHRGGACCAPENTLAAIDLAFRHGADHVEVDVRESADGVAFLMHDENLDRTTDGKGAAGKKSSSELRRLDAGSSFGPAFAGEHVPTLAEALKVAAGRGRLLLDVKSPGMGSAIRRALEKAGVGPERIWVEQNQNTEAAKDFQTSIPGVEVLWMAAPKSLDTASFAKLKKLGVTGFELEYGTFTKKFVDAAHANGMLVFAFTIMDPATMLKAVEMGVDGVETDYPGFFKAMMPKPADPPRLK